MTRVLTENINDFDQWKSDISRTLSRFRLWLRRNELFNSSIDEQLNKFQESLKIEYLTLAFVGEFSRGKTELINSLFFAEYGQRILPSEAGRTTMCPTELFYDRKEDRAYLKLLPIETRLETTTLSQYRENPELWREIPLITGSALEMTQALKAITETKQTSVQEALNLGFDASMLEPISGEIDLVEIPAWRHALVSFPHDLLKKGLCILDTPGLNALGSEPELTLKLLPQVQAIILLLGADTGVTASDMSIWKDYIQTLDQDNSLELFAVLNKIDTLWDDLLPVQDIDNAIERIVELTAKQLQLEESKVLPVSAKKALTAKVRNDIPLLIKSQITNLEHVLSVNLLANKEKVICGNLIEDVEVMIAERTQLLANKIEKLLTQKRQLESLTDDNKDKISVLIAENTKDLKEYERRIISVKPSQRLLERQAAILLLAISKKLLSKEVDVTLNDLVHSKTTAALFRHMKQFYLVVKTIMQSFTRETELTNKMVVSLYKKNAGEFNVTLLEPKLFPAKKLSRQLESIIKRSKRLDNNIFTAFTEQSVSVTRFFSGTVSEVMEFFQSARDDLTHWTQNVVLPLTHQLKIQQKLIIEHQNELLELKKSKSNLNGKIKGLSHLIDDINIEIETANELSRTLRGKKAISVKDNVLHFSSAAADR